MAKSAKSKSIDLSQRVQDRFEIIKETTKGKELSKEIDKLLKILESEEITRSIIIELKLAIDKQDVLLNKAKIEAYEWFKNEFLYFRSLDPNIQAMVMPLVERGENYLMGKDGEFNRLRPCYLWERLWGIYQSICSCIASFGDSSFLDGRARISIREETLWNRPSALLDKVQKILGNIEYLPSSDEGKEIITSLQRGFLRAKFNLELLPITFQRGYVEELYIPPFIQKLFEYEKRRFSEPSLSEVTELFRYLRFISAWHNWKLRDMKANPNSFAERIGLSFPLNPLELDMKIEEFGDQLLLSSLLKESINKEAIFSYVKRFLQYIKDLLLEDQSLKGPKLKSHLSRIAHDWLYLEIHKYVRNEVEKGNHLPQHVVIDWAKKLRSIPEHLKNSVSDNLLEEVCKEVAKITGWKCPGGRPHKEKTPPSKSIK